MSDSEMTDSTNLSDSGNESDHTEKRSDSVEENKSQRKPAKQHAAKMKAALVDNRPPYCSGTIAVDPRDLVLYFGTGENVGCVDFSNPSDAELEKLMQACDPATFGRGEKHIYDESVRRAGKLDTDKFSAKLDPVNIRRVEGDGSKAVNLLDAVKFGLLWGDTLEKKFSLYCGTSFVKDVRAELYKLNVYGKDGFFKRHKDTPRATNMFGSLVIILPTKHVGGGLVFRRDNKEWTFDSASALASAPGPSIAYASFFSDVEHEVLPVKEGYRVTLTYNLYFKKPLKARTPRIPAEVTIPSNFDMFKKALEDSLADKAFLPQGGKLGFGLQHLYPVFKKLWACRGDLIKPHLKGLDALVLAVCQEVGLKTRVCFVFTDEPLVSENVPAYTLEGYRDVSDEIENKYGGEDSGDLTWVVGHEHSFNEHPIDFFSEETYGNEPAVEHTYAEIVLIAHVGPANARKTLTEDELARSDDGDDTVRFAKDEEEEQDSDNFDVNVEE